MGLIKERVGWCHHCGVLQLRSQARAVYRWDGPEDANAECVTDDCDQTWEFGIFVMPEGMSECGRANHESWSPIPCEQCGRAG
jgi:hypothetical protein